MMDAVYKGVWWFVATAVFLGGWVCVLLVLGLVARILGGADDDEDGDGE